MSGAMQSNVGNSQVYNDGDQRNPKGSVHDRPAYEEGVPNSHDVLDSKYVSPSHCSLFRPLRLPFRFSPFLPTTLSLPYELPTDPCPQRRALHRQPPRRRRKAGLAITTHYHGPAEARAGPRQRAEPRRTGRRRVAGGGRVEVEGEGDQALSGSGRNA